MTFAKAGSLQSALNGKSQISGCLEDANVKYKEELDSLLTLRFQRFDKSQIMNV